MYYSIDDFQILVENIVLYQNARHVPLNPSRAPRLTPDFLMGSMLLICLVFCVVAFRFVCLRPVCCVRCYLCVVFDATCVLCSMLPVSCVRCYLCLWVVYSWLFDLFVFVLCVLFDATCVLCSMLPVYFVRCCLCVVFDATCVLCSMLPMCCVRCDLCVVLDATCVLCSMLPVCCVRCYLCLWVVYSWLPLLFSLALYVKYCENI
jgi:hypothetical protein